MHNITNIEYWKEVRDTASNIIDHAKNSISEMDEYDTVEELIGDLVLHETIDGHQWIIYTAYNLDVIQASPNDQYYLDNFGAEALEHSLKDGGLDTLHCHIAFWAMYADVQEEITDQLENSIAA